MKLVGLLFNVAGVVIAFMAASALVIRFFDACSKIDEIHAKLFPSDEKKTK